ncbi:MAG: urease accessory protein UreF [Verrucomicrobia bacterium]|nr:urease accessory protein UreF [Verrucomicrobiota bacterium]
MNPDELCRALHLASPALPIGSFSYSQGLETAVDLGLIRNEADALRWIANGLTEIVGRCDAPVVAFIYRACQEPTSADLASKIGYWNSWFLASRESMELRRETEQMGWSLMQLAKTLGWITPMTALGQLNLITFPTAFALSAAGLALTETTTLTAFCFSWLETQVAAAMKLVPLGQAAGHRILNQCRTSVPMVIRAAANTTPEDISSRAPMLGILSARHESQYSRLFRS